MLTTEHKRELTIDTMASWALEGLVESLAGKAVQRIIKAMV